MNKQRTRIIAILCLHSVIGAFNVLGDGKYPKGDYIPKEITEYRSWVKVTPRPHQVQITLEGIDGIAD